MKMAPSSGIYCKCFNTVQEFSLKNNTLKNGTSRTAQYESATPKDYFRRYFLFSGFVLQTVAKGESSHDCAENIDCKICTFTFEISTSVFRNIYVGTLAPRGQEKVAV